MSWCAIHRKDLKSTSSPAVGYFFLIVCPGTLSCTRAGSNWCTRCSISRHCDKIMYNDRPLDFPTWLAPFFDAQMRRRHSTVTFFCAEENRRSRSHFSGVYHRRPGILQLIIIVIREMAVLPCDPSRCATRVNARSDRNKLKVYTLKR